MAYQAVHIKTTMIQSVNARVRCALEIKLRKVIYRFQFRSVWDRKEETDKSQWKKIFEKFKYSYTPI